jgi:hypothetical protein
VFTGQRDFFACSSIVLLYIFDPLWQVNLFVMVKNNDLHDKQRGESKRVVVCGHSPAAVLLLVTETNLTA